VALNDLDALASRASEFFALMLILVAVATVAVDAYAVTTLK